MIRTSSNLKMSCLLVTGNANKSDFFQTDSETGQLGQMTDAVLLSFHASANFLKSTEDFISVADQVQKKAKL